MNQKEKIFIGVAWPYVNGDIHVGHLAGYLIPCDIFARYSRLSGKEVLMVSGTDCHGTPITIEADKRGITPKEVVDIYDPKVRELIDLYDSTYDIFTTTITDNHKKVTQDVFLHMLNNGFIVKQVTKQYYSELDNKFLPDRYVEGTCPYCNTPDQRADQCENCGRTLGMGELIDAHSKLTGAEVVLKETEHYFIDFPKLQKEIEDYVEPRTNWKDWVYKETWGWLKEGLQQRAITRDIDWGVEIPTEKIPQELQISGSESKRFYVWFDAVIGYLSATIEWAQKNDRNYKEFWQNENAKHYYFMGQDNLAFHTIFWPGQIIAQRQKLNLPYFVSVNKFLNFNGAKFSKSRGVFLNSIDVAKEYGVDSIRFYISSILPENKETNWDWNDFRSTINSSLVGNVGNFIHRSLSFYIHKLDSSIKNLELDKEVAEETKKVFQEVSIDLESCRFVPALEKILKYSTFGNQYFDKKKPWSEIKDNKANAEKTIYNCIQIIENLSILLKPYIPHGIFKLEEYGFSVKNFEFTLLDINKLNIPKDIKPIFQKIEEPKEEPKEDVKREWSENEIKELVEQIQIVEVSDIQKHPDADKLWVVKINDGTDNIQIVTGADNIKIGDLVPYLGVGKVVPGFLFFENVEIKLKAKPLRGIDSFGMILAEDEIGLSKDHEGIYILDTDKSNIGKSILEVLKDSDITKILNQIKSN